MANQTSKRAIETQEEHMKAYRVSACHHHGIVPDIEDTQSLKHYLALLLPQVPVHLPPKLDDGGQADLVPDVI